ncbi:MAG: DUF6265 family protein [Balneolales bacterium]|nr:DUF6265 family protein [Balneolales bacterium]
MKTYLFILFTLLFNALSHAQTLEDLNWMAGYWTSSEDGTTMEELWTPPSAGLMLALHRDVFANGRTSFEYIRIVQTGNKIHFVAQPGGGESVAFALVESIPQKVVFENLEHDFPQRIIYSRNENALTARIENEAGDQAMQWIWKKTIFN